jgi:hypothetical protein
MERQFWYVKLAKQIGGEGTTRNPKREALS